LYSKRLITGSNLGPWPFGYSRTILRAKPNEQARAQLTSVVSCHHLPLKHGGHEKVVAQLVSWLAEERNQESHHTPGILFNYTTTNTINKQQQ
jgi:hypothetical protein